MTYGDLPSAKTASSPVARPVTEPALYLDRLADEQAKHAKAEFLAKMSHELRTPLNAIIGFSEIMQAHRAEPDVPTSGAVFEYAEHINRAAKQLLGLLEDILNLSAIETGQTALQETEVDVARMARDCLDQLAPQADIQNLTLELDAPEELPGLRADPSRLRQILLHMLSNAAKFTPEGGTIVLRIATEPDGDVAISVRDSGIGMRNEDIPTALSPFGQVEGAMFRRYAGSGLGLPLTKALVEMHGGRINIESCPGVGTTATASFPKERINHRSRVGPASEVSLVM